jgi:hypothetical protein
VSESYRERVAALEAPADIGAEMAALQREFEARIAAALARLPVPEERRPWIADRAGYLFDICVTAAVLEVPLERRGGAKAAADKLAMLRKQMLAVGSTIERLPVKARWRLDAAFWRDRERTTGRDDPVPHRLGFASDALALARAAEAARLDLLARPDPDAHRPRQHEAAHVTEEAIRVYENLTGRTAKLPTTDPDTSEMSGLLVDFLGDLFEAFGIAAKPASQLKTAVKKRRAGK